jgi:hypothetical protein
MRVSKILCDHALVLKKDSFTSIAEGVISAYAFGSE